MSEERNEHEISQNQQRTLQAISQIDDKIIDKNTGKRIVLLAAAHRRAKKRWTAIISVAASLALILTSLLIMIPVLAKQVPIYTGMTVSGEAPVTLENGMLPTYFDPGTPSGNANGNKHVSGDHTGADKTIGSQPFDTSIGDAVGALTVEGATERYYTVPNADVYITVHIKNPDQFEILSFTLNGKKYQNNMFEYGSDLENIILKVNVGDVEGVVSYTIDAIKYVDGTDIKDVQMDGEKTVEIGVYTEKQPTALFSAAMSGFDMMTFTVDLSDTMNLFASLSGDVEAVLFDGSSIVARKTLAPTGKTTVTYDGLLPGKLYEYAVIASYDALDGKGVVRHVIASHAMHTRSYLLFDDVTVGTKRVSYTFHWDADATGSAVSAVALYQNGEKLRDVDPAATEITGLSVDTTYTLVATYQREGRDEQISITFTTEKLIVTVNQYLENLDGTYALVDTKSEEVAEGTVYTPLLGSHVGFTTPTVLPVTVTDSSYTFECRFDRTVYDVTFVDNNGSINTEQLKFGTPLAPTKAPTREGFTFGGWFENAELTVAADSTVLAKSVTVYAKWLYEAAPTDLTYTVSGGEVTITGLLNQGITDLIIPAYIAGQPVTAIGNAAFYDKTTLRTVVLPDTVLEISGNAFRSSGLVDITWSENLITIGDGAFGFTSITTLTVPASVSTIGANAFEYCASLGTIIFEDRSTTLSVGMLAFREAGTSAATKRVIVEDLADWFNIAYNTSGLASNPLVIGADLYHNNDIVSTLTIPEGVTTIRPYLFAGCTSLTSVTIPADVTSVSESAFAVCSNLQSVTFTAGSEASIGAGAFRGCSKLSSINLPIALKGIASDTFKGCAMLTSIDIPDSVTSVDSSAFDNCAAVTVVDGISYVDGWVLGGTPTSGSLALQADTVGIANGAFRGITVNGVSPLPEGLKYIGSFAFAGFVCDSGTLRIPDSVVSINSNAFDDSSLVNEDVATGLVYVDRWLVNAGNYQGFDGFVDLRADTVGIASGAGLHVYLDDTAVLAIPEGIRHLDGGAIYVYTNNVVPTLSLPASLLTIKTGSIIIQGSDAYWQGITVAAGNTVYSGEGNCLVEKATGTLLLGSATSIIPTDGSVTEIGVGAFEYCKGLIAIHIPASVTKIRTGAFIGCTSLTTLTFDENSCLKVIWGSAFRDCRRLTGVVLPDSLTTLYHAAFYGYKQGGYIVVPTSITTADLSFMAHNGIIYYCGEAGAAADMILPPSRIYDYNMAIYYYSATKPAADHGSFWHWVGDVPVLWSEND